MRIGVIGTGTIGGMLARAFAESVRHDVTVCNRTPSKAHDLAVAFPNIHVAKDAQAVVREADIVFLATKARDARQLLADLGPQLTSEQLLVTTISHIPVADLESHTAAPCAMVIPSVVQNVRSGILLVTCGARMQPHHQDLLHRVLSEISTPFPIDEDQVRVASDLSSCGPAFLSYVVSEWAAAAARTGALDSASTEVILTQTLIGLADLLKSGMTLQDVIRRVAVPGGVTEAGLVSLARDCPPTFDHLHQTTRMFASGSMMVVHLTG